MLRNLHVETLGCEGASQVNLLANGMSRQIIQENRKTQHMVKHSWQVANASKGQSSAASWPVANPGQWQILANGKPRQFASPGRWQTPANGTCQQFAAVSRGKMQAPANGQRCQVAKSST